MFKTNWFCHGFWVGGDLDHRCDGDGDGDGDADDGHAHDEHADDDDLGNGHMAAPGW